MTVVPFPTPARLRDISGVLWCELSEALVPIACFGEPSLVPWLRGNLAVSPMPEGDLPPGVDDEYLEDKMTIFFRLRGVFDADFC